MGSVCEICGDIGFEEALVDCDTCALGTIHRYCINIVPVPIEGYITWFCANCAATDNDQQPHTLTHTAEASSSTTDGPPLQVTASTYVPQDHVSSTRRLTFSPNSDEEAHSGAFNMIQITEFNSLALNQCGARPIMTPTWRGSVTVTKGNILGLVAYESVLVCPRVHDIASSLHTCLSVAMYPRLEIWPKSFSKNGGPKDENIALYFFPSRHSNENQSEFKLGEGRVVDPQKNFDSLLLEMKNNDFALRCILDDAELLLFTSYMLPMRYWNLRSNDCEYLWGVFRSKQTDRQ